MASLDREGNVSFEQERLRILESVANGELTPQEGHLQIAMLKHAAGKGDAAPEQGVAIDVDQPGAQQTRQQVRMGPLLAIMALPFVMAGTLLFGFLAFVFALPTYFGVWLWNAHLVGLHPALPVLSFWPTFGLVILFNFAWTLLSWRRNLRVAFKVNG
jgi:hypothetical protein